MIRVLHIHIVSCPIVVFFFFWSYDQGWPGGMLKPMKNDHILVFLAVWIFFPKFLGRLKSGSC